MIFAVAMTFIDRSIVSIATPTIQRDLGFWSSGAVGDRCLPSDAGGPVRLRGRLADLAGHRRMVVLGVIIFAGASALYGLTPRGSTAEAWLVSFRVVQGAGGAMPGRRRHRGGHVRPLARPGARPAFGIAGGLTAIGPIAAAT